MHICPFTVGETEAGEHRHLPEIMLGAIVAAGVRPPCSVLSTLAGELGALGLALATAQHGDAQDSWWQQLSVEMPSTPGA